MRSVIVWWAVSALILTAAASLIGRLATGNRTGILIDTRGRYSLTQFQLVLWTIVVLSLVNAVFLARAMNGIAGALDFKIPDQLLIVMGISVAGFAGSTAIKAAKDASHPEGVAASNASDRPRIAQMFLVEEGELADKVVDVAKFQNFWITLLLVVAYIVVVIMTIETASTVAAIALPGFSQTFLVLLGVSHAGYLAGKLPNQPGTPRGLTVALRARGAVPGAAACGQLKPQEQREQDQQDTYVPRNPAGK